jgi:hypothetical protein
LACPLFRGQWVFRAEQLMFTSEFIFTIPIEQVIQGALAFSPYGKALVAITTTLLRVWRHR